MIAAMRVVHVETGRHLYGGAAQVRYLVEGLAAAHVDNVVVCARGGELAARVRGAEVIELPMRGDLDFGFLARCLRVMRARAPDLVHVHSRRGAELYGGWAAALARVPAVLTRRVDAAEPQWLVRLKCRPYRGVIALSRAIDSQLRAAGVDESRLERIPSAVDTQRFRPDPAARARLLAEFGLPPDALVIGVVAQLIARKRHGWLLARLPELVRRFSSVRMLCFGRGPLEEPLAAEIAARGLAEHVRLVGFRHDMTALVPGFDLLVHPAEREGLGVALLEAASAGVPVVACAAGGVPEVVDDGRTGLVVACDAAAGFERAVARLLGSVDERRRLGAAARARAERDFGVAALVAAHRALYARVLGEPAPAPAHTALR
jgi:glycosyltransferase involved in cell wall biosynthesis